MKTLLVNLLFIFFSLNTISQQTHIQSITLYVNGGALMPHNSIISYLVKEHQKGFSMEFDLNKKKYSYYDQLYRYPTSGVGILRSSLGNKNTFGSVSSIYSYIKIPFGSSESRFSSSYQICLGIGWIDKIFDLESNYANVAMSSHINAFVRFGYTLEFELFDQLNLISSVYLSHLSNGRMHTPNLGLNSATLSIGAVKKFSTFEKTHISPPTLTNRWSFELIPSVGIKSPDIFKNEPYTIFSFQSKVLYALNFKRKIGIGADFFYDPSRELYLKKKNIEPTPNNLWMPGITLFHDLYYKNMAMTLGLGSYLGVTHTEFTNLYSRVGLKYHLWDKLVLNLTLKSHNANADFIEWGVGYYW